MINSFKLKNFRSYAEEADLTFEAQPSELNSGAVKAVALNGGPELHLLTVVAIFGANAAGKSYVIHALAALAQTVANSLSYKSSVGLPGWIPFFTPEKSREPMEASLDFIIEGKRYIYSLILDPFYQLVLHEGLELYIDGSFKQVYARTLNKDNDDRFTGYALSLGEGWLSATLDLSDMNILGNQLMLSWLATKEANGLQHVAEYIGSLQVLTPDTLPSTGQQISAIAEKVFQLKKMNGQSPIFRRFVKMMQIADLGITDVSLGYHDDSDFQFPESVSSDIQRAFINENRWDFKLFHKVGNLDEPLGLPLRLESQGTQTLVKIVPYLFQALENGSFLAYDEISTAVHPELLKFLVNLFQNSKSNPKGAQLLFTTQDASIASSDTLRADQVWFVEKKDGSSDLYSAQDFDGVTVTGIPFEKWYRAGRFGAIPSFGNVDYIFNEDEQKTER